MAMSPGGIAPVATWYSSGWNRWKLRLSMSVTGTPARPSRLAADRPAKPPPTMTTSLMACHPGRVVIPAKAGIQCLSMLFPQPPLAKNLPRGLGDVGHVPRVHRPADRGADHRNGL